MALKVDGVSVAKGFVDLAPGGRSHKRFLHRLTGETGGAHDVEVEIDGDAFRLDDQRLAHVELARSMSVLIVTATRAVRATRTSHSSSRLRFAMACLARW